MNPSATRNSPAILEILKLYIKSNAVGIVLEISSGVGSHVNFFAPHFPYLTFQPTEYEKSLLNSIDSYAKDCKTNNILSPLHVDVRDTYTKWGNFQPKSIDFMLNINMIHISDFSCTIGLFRNAGILLKENGLLFTYGPYAIDGVLIPDSNVQFDALLKQQNREWGVRDIRNLEKLAEENSIYLKKYMICQQIIRH